MMDEYLICALLTIASYSIGFFLRGKEVKKCRQRIDELKREKPYWDEVIKHLEAEIDLIKNIQSQTSNGNRI
jgi:hypothetical protein